MELIIVSLEESFIKINLLREAMEKNKVRLVNNVVRKSKARLSSELVFSEFTSSLISLHLVIRTTVCQKTVFAIWKSISEKYGMQIFRDMVA